MVANGIYSFTTCMAHTQLLQSEVELASYPGSLGTPKSLGTGLEVEHVGNVASKCTCSTEESSESQTHVQRQATS